MSAATINGAAYQPVDAAFPAGVATRGIYWALPPLGVEPDRSGPAWDDTLIRFIGEQTGIGRKRLNYGIRYLWIDLVFVGTPAQVRGDKANLLINLTGLNRYSITLPDDVETPGCTLVTPMPRGSEKTVGNGMIARMIPCVFQQLSDSN